MASRAKAGEARWVAKSRLEACLRSLERTQPHRPVAILKCVRFLPLFPLLFLPKFAFAAPLPAFEGTLTQTQNGVTTRAKIAWAPPETLRIETLPDPQTGAAPVTIVARGDQTLLLDSATKRARRAPYNIAKSWWRGADARFGGPANFLFAGTPFPANAPEGKYSLRDTVIFGGGGRDAYYAAKKVAARRFAAQIATTQTSRVERDERGKTLLDAQITLDAAGLPRAATLVSGGQTTSFAYDLTPSPAPPPIEEIAAPITEDIDLKSPSAYAGGDASALFNRGAALAQNEDAPRAIAALEAAALAAPDSSAPPLALFDIALDLRQSARAQAALGKLAELGVDKAEIELRRARLSILNRDRAGALSALQSAAQAAPGNLSLQLAQAEVARSLGDFDGARALYRGVLAATSSQFDAQRAAAENLAIYATFEELPALLTSIPTATDAQKIARALIQLRLNQAPEVAEFARDEFELALALGFERAARDDEAQSAWRTLETRAPDALKNRARAHQMTLLARRGDVAGAINKWREWNAALALPSERDAAQDAFFRAFQKAFRSDSLKNVLANRATATAATEDDLRLFLAYQESFGTSADVVAAIETGANRFGGSAFWMGKRAENLLATANEQRANDAGTARREQLYGQAMALLDDAIRAAPDEPFYRAQKALAATQRAAKIGAVVDPTIAVRNRAAAKRETEAFLAASPADPDTLVGAALQNLVAQTDVGAREAIRLATLALDSAPGEGDGDRHTLVWAAHQALASAYKRLNQLDLAGEQWQILLLGARDATEQAALASNYFFLLDGPPNGAGAAGAATSSAALLAQLSTEKWDYSAARALLETVATRMARSPRARAIAAALAAMPGEGAILSRATLSLRRVEAARRALEVPEAPPAADAELERAQRDLALALGALRAVAGSPDRVVSARAAAFVAENAGLGGQERLELLQSALEKEPRDAALRFALLGALDGPQNLVERERAAKILDFSLDSRRSLASAARRAGDGAGALRLAEEAFAFGARAPELTGGDLQRVAFTLAKSAFAAGQNSRALEIYNGLSLPQWNDADRAAALLALLRSYEEAKRPEEVAAVRARIAALGLEPADLEAAQAFADELE